MSDLRADALESLTGWAAPTEDQAALRARYLRHLGENPDGMYRSSFPDHLTAGVLVLSQDLDAVLLNLHGKAHRWFHFGGHCEAEDQTLRGAALREAQEESGLAQFELTEQPVQLSEHGVEFCDPRGDVRHLDVRYAARASADAEPARSEESVEVRWWPLQGLPDLEPEMHELIALSRAAFE